MAITTGIALRQDGRVELYDRQKAQQSTSTSKTSNNEDDSANIKDVVNLDVEGAFREKIQNAKSTDELVSILQDGQKEAREALAKFKSLLNGNRDSLGASGYERRSQILFEATQKAVVEVMMEQTEDKTTVSVKVSMSFEARLMTHVRELDSDFFEDWKKDTKSTMGFVSDIDWEK